MLTPDMMIRWRGSLHHQSDQTRFRNTSLSKQKGTPESMDLLTYTFFSNGSIQGSKSLSCRTTMSKVARTGWSARTHHAILPSQQGVAPGNLVGPQRMAKQKRAAKGAPSAAGSASAGVTRTGHTEGREEGAWVTGAKRRQNIAFYTLRNQSARDCQGHWLELRQNFTYSTECPLDDHFSVPLGRVNLHY